MIIKWLKSAVLDLKSIREFIALDKPSVALDVAKNIQKSTDLLAFFPAMGRPGRVPDTRELIMGRHYPYIIVYRNNGDILEILRILHAARKWPDNF